MKDQSYLKQMSYLIEVVKHKPEETLYVSALDIIFSPMDKFKSCHQENGHGA